MSIINIIAIIHLLLILPLFLVSLYVLLTTSVTVGTITSILVIVTDIAAQVPLLWRFHFAPGLPHNEVVMDRHSVWMGFLPLRLAPVTTTECARWCLQTTAICLSCRSMFRRQILLMYYFPSRCYSEFMSSCIWGPQVLELAIGHAASSTERLRFDSPRSKKKQKVYPPLVETLELERTTLRFIKKR